MIPFSQTAIAPLPDPTPHAYRVWHRTTICRHCDTHHEYPELFAVYQMPSRYGFKTLKQFKPCNMLSYNLPVEYVQREPTSIPFCHECYDTIREHIATLPLPPIEDKRILNSTIQPPEEPLSVKQQAKPKASLQDVASFFK